MTYTESLIEVGQPILDAILQHPMVEQLGEGTLNAEPFHLREWIEIHATDEFRELVRWLRSEMDAEAKALSPRRRERVYHLFDRAVTLEIEFFDTVYGGEY